MKNAFVFAAVLLFLPNASAQKGQPIKVKLVYDTTDASSAAVGPLLVKHFSPQPTLFTVVNGDDRDLTVVTDCYRETPNDPYSCFYTASKWIGSNEALLGAAVVVQKLPEDAATDLFKNILQDILERWDSTNRRMLIAKLETCLELTESSCAVPDPLVAELKTKTINLSQYMRKGGLKP